MSGGSKIRDLIKEAKKRHRAGLSGKDYRKIRNREIAQYAAFGAAMGPLVGSLSNMIMRGKPAPTDISLKRWIPASMMSGALYSGVIPVVRRAIHDYNVKSLKKSRKKHASLAGQDLRSPLTGGTKMPTEDSKSLAASNLRKSQNSAEVGPTPTEQQLHPSGPTIRQIASHTTHSRVGSLPKLGSLMNRNDPLVRYLLKQAALETNGPDPAESSNLNLPETEPNIQAGSYQALEENLDNMPKGKEEDSLVDESPKAPDRLVQRSSKDLVDYLNDVLDSREGRRRKYTDKDYAAEAGEVDKVLGR